MEVFELGAGTVEVSLMKEQLETAEDALAAATEERRNLDRTQKPMSIDMAKDRDVALD